MLSGAFQRADAPSKLSYLGESRYRTALHREYNPCEVVQDTKHTDLVGEIVRHPDGTEVAFWGRIFNSPALAANVGLHRNCSSAQLIHKLYLADATQFPARLNGDFVGAVFDHRIGRLILFRDHFGVQPLYYFLHNNHLIFSSQLRSVVAISESDLELNRRALAKYLIFNYNFGRESVLRGVRKLPPSHSLTITANRAQLTRYWAPDFRERKGLTMESAAQELRERILGAVRIRTAQNLSPGVFLSGGFDSSTVTAMIAKTNDHHLRTFSYRCRGQSYDESYYARTMAQAAGAEHRQIDYGPEDLPLMVDAVASMDEPFCESGINLATFLLAKAASEAGVDALSTGDGGDELFAGHPVYFADKIARYIDVVPSGARRLVARLVAELIPDSERKLTLPLKAKRFLESWGRPSDLLSHRWRIQYSGTELRQLLCQDWISKDEGDSWLAEDIRPLASECDSSVGQLGVSLFVDYYTLVDFYLRRSDLCRVFGLTPKIPMLDPELVSFCAGLPSRFKIEGIESKVILKRAVSDDLPPAVAYRKDKLGHSIPLKNWLRDSSVAKEFVLDHISHSRIRDRGLFDPKFVQRLIDGHMSRKVNNANKLWALAVLEMWLSIKAPEYSQPNSRPQLVQTVAPI